MAIRIMECGFADIMNLAGKAARERVSISNTSKTQWFTVHYDGKRIKACAGAMAVPGAGFRIKGVWVEPPMRGKGVGEALVDEIRKYADRRSAAFLEAFAYNADFYKRKGFIMIGTLPNGAAKMRLPL